MKLDLFDSVELSEPVAKTGLLERADGQWPAGTAGAIVDDLSNDRVLVELTDSGKTLDVVEVPRSAVVPRELTTA